MTPDELDRRSEEARQRMEAKKKQSFFRTKTADEWNEEAENTPDAKMLFSEMWYEGEICILFADTNVGKSILAVQIADSISRGVPIEGLKYEAGAQKVIYLDFELSRKQFGKRYNNEHKQRYRFNTNFYRSEINPDCEVPECFGSFEEFIYYSIEVEIVDTGAKIIIIDNITFLRDDNERAKDAADMMKQIKAMKARYDLSVLALAHTPKRNATLPITQNDLQGSKMLMNFCDSSFSIGESQSEEGLRYVKQIKVRDNEKLYGAENVWLARIEKPHNFLQFSFIGNGTEYDHLKEMSSEQKQELIENVKKKAAEGIPQREIAKLYNISAATVNRYLAK
jgi:hypothetical protein